MCLEHNHFTNDEWMRVNARAEAALVEEHDTEWPVDTCPTRKRKIKYISNILV
jgi:hypothetical protein